MNAMLLARDVEEIAIMRFVLQRIGTAVQVVQGVEEAVSEWGNQAFDLIVLVFERDIPLLLIRQLRSRTAAPMVLMADPVPEGMQVTLLDAGVDLLLMRPFSTRLVIAQLRALLRRSAGMPFFSLPTLTRGAVALDPSGRTVQLGDRPVRHLTQLEFRLLYTLMMNTEQVFPAETLVEHVWGYSGRGDRDLVRGLIRRLRAKLEPDPKSPCYIVTMPGVGYVFRYPRE